MQLFNQETMNAPWGLASRLKLLQLALDFFNVDNLAGSYKAIGKAHPHNGKLGPLTANEFLQYVHAKATFERKPNAMRVAQMLERMVSGGLLIRAGYGHTSVGGLGDHYLHAVLAWEISRGPFMFAWTLGPEFLYQLCAPGVVHITGTDDKGNVIAGTGIVVAPSFILTCRHVVADMNLDIQQEFQGKKLTVNDNSIYKHPDVDVAIIKVDRPLLMPLMGAKFQRPVVAQSVFTLGYPRLPSLQEAPVIMQQGAVTCEQVTALSGEELFLFSAISRPGNSGGPVMSADGYVVGLCNVDAKGEYPEAEPFSPHYAGIPGQIVVEAVGSLGLGIQLPFEEYD